MLELNHLDYFRLPWNLADNAISWLEPTSKCNLYCEGCYRKNDKDGQKSLANVKEEIDVFARLRKSDCISIAGGDPLTHPEILDIVKYVKEKGMKPIINTNGLALTKEYLSNLKKAGVYGFTFHIDSKQIRPDWKGKNEIELNELRYHYAKMLADEGGIACSFNSTVYEDTLPYVPELLKWAHKNIDIVHTMVFILYRAVNNQDYDYFAGTKKIEMGSLVYKADSAGRADIKAPEVIETIRKVYPDFDSCAYLNGSEQPDSFKWLLSGRLGTKKNIFGYVGHKGMEAIQMFHHLFFNTYLSYAHPKEGKKGKMMLLLGTIDKKLRKAFFNFYKNPFNIFKRLYYQSVLIIQPVDFLKDGKQNMCDGCPDMTVWEGKLVWSCRMEEQLNFGDNIKAYPKNMMN
jgi:MoaA/NifB/PqqE/SkfB family radical SAM enzyme